MTARWVVDEVAPQRDLEVTWQPISLLFKNEPDPESDYYVNTSFTRGLLRVAEAVRAGEGDEAYLPLYWEYGRRIHHDQNRDFGAADALAGAGLDPEYAEAFVDEAWDAEIRKRMDIGLGLAGDNIGTPIIGFDNDDGERVGYFGPVITRVPDTEKSLRLWDGLMTMATVPGFWELKRTRTERPDFGERP